MAAGVWIGTSGWSYKGWAESFYPAQWPKSKLLEFYFTQFPSVEINATFYRLPSVNMVEGWRRKAPHGFRFALKGSRYITHLKKLVDVDDALRIYFERVKPLQKLAGPVLWQLPPSLHKDMERLDAFLAKLPHEFRHAVEFRHTSWVGDDVLDLLREHRAACVWLSAMRMPMNFTATADFVYARFHGLEGGAAHDYNEGELKPWAEAFRDAAQNGKPAYAYFNNDWNTRAPNNARTLMRMVGEWSVAPFVEAQEPKPARVGQ